MPTPQQQLRVVDKTRESILPLGSKPMIWRPERLKYMMIGPPKWGKTTFFSGCPDACLLAFEAGYGEVDCPKVVITSWDRSFKERKLGWDQDEDGIVYTSAMELVEELENYCPYKMLVVDTIDMATKMASEYHCALAHVDHPSEGGDFGRGWDLLQTNPIRKFYNRLVKLGCGVAVITHSTEKSKTDDGGSFGGRAKKETSLPGGVQKFCHTQSDVIMHGFFSRKRRGNKDRDRYISFDGNDYLMAGTRIRKVYIPNKYIVTPPNAKSDNPPWKQWESFFTNSPEAGQQAENEFVRLYVGADDETTSIPKPTKTITKEATREPKDVSSVRKLNP